MSGFRCPACDGPSDRTDGGLCTHCLADVTAASAAAGRPIRRARLYLGKFWDRLKPGQTRAEKYYGVPVPDDPYAEQPAPIVPMERRTVETKRIP